MSADPAARAARFEEVLAEYLQASERGAAPDQQELLRRHPELANDLAAYFANREQFERLAGPLGVEPDATLAPTAAVGEVGPRVRYFGDYELLEEIGRGGMGVVYKARQVNLNRVVALKMILSGQLANDEDVRRFRAEAEAAAKLDHPGIVPVFEVGEHEGHHYFSMSYIEGESLAHRLTAGLPAPSEAAELVKQVAEAVAYAHVEGVVHRDLKPANVLIDRAGQPRLTDFGLAKRVPDGPSSAGAATDTDVKTLAADLTRTGQILGTPSYMPPEQASGQRGVVGPLADIYSLGAVLYCVLTGRPPFQAANPLDTLLQVLEREPVPPRQLNAAVPRDLETICLKCLNKEPRKRYASAQDLVADLDRYLNGRPIVARPTGAGERLWKWVKRRPAAAALLLVSCLGSIGVVSLLVALLNNAEQRARMVRDLSVADHDLHAAREETARQYQATESLKEAAKKAQQKMEADRKEFATVFARVQADLKVTQAAHLGALNETNRQKQLAKELEAKARREAQGLRLIGQSSALRVGNPGLALLLAIEGQRLAPGAMANNALREAIDECHEEVTIPVGYAYRSAIYSPDGKVILSLPPGHYNAGPVRLWDPATGRHVADLAVPPVWLSSATFSPDSRRVVFTFNEYNSITWYGKPPVIYTDSVARVWDVASRKEIAILRGHRSRVISARFSADGTKLVTASWDGTVRIWDTATWKERHLIAVHAAGVAGAVFSPDGKSVLTASTSWRRQRSQDVELPKIKGALLDPPAGTLPPGVKPGDRPGSQGYSGGFSGSQFHERDAVAVWDAATGKRRAVLKPGPPGALQAVGHDESFFPLAWNPKGDRVLTWTWSPTASNRITLWDVASGEARVQLATGIPSHTVLSPDGSRVLTVPQAGDKLSLWDAVAGKEVLAVRVAAGVAGAPSFSPDGRWLLAACGDKAARIWSAETGEELWCFRGHQLGLTSTAFSPDGTRVITTGADGTLRIWDPRRGRDYARVLRGSAAVHKVAWSPDGKRLALAGHDAALWDPQSGRRLHALHGLDPAGKPLPREESFGGVLSLEFSGDGRRLLVATKEAQAHVTKRTFFGLGKSVEEDLPYTPVRLWDVESGKQLVAYQGTRGQVGPALFSPAGRLVLAAETGYHDLHYFSSTGYQTGNAGKYLADGQAYVWDAATGRPVQTLKGHEQGITAYAWSPDGQRVLTADCSNGFRADGGAARIWDVQSGRPVVTLEGNRGAVRLATFSPDGKQAILLQQTSSAYVEIWDATTGRIVRTLGTPTWYGYERAWDAKGKRTIYKRNGRVIHVAADGQAGHAEAITYAAYSPDGRRIVTTSSDKTARLWDAATGELVFVLRGHILGVEQAAFSADGKRVVTASVDETARVWDADTGAEVFTLAGHQGPVLTAVFSPDGKAVATGSADGTARVWPLDPLAVARSRKPRELTPDERERFAIP